MALGDQRPGVRQQRLQMPGTPCRRKEYAHRGSLRHSAQEERDLLVDLVQLVLVLVSHTRQDRSLGRQEGSRGDRRCVAEGAGLFARRSALRRVTCAVSLRGGRVPVRGGAACVTEDTTPPARGSCPSATGPQPPRDPTSSFCKRTISSARSILAMTVDRARPPLLDYKAPRRQEPSRRSKTAIT
jgi:hypothetical protein